MNRKLSPLTLLLILTGLNLFNYFDRFVLSAVLPAIKEELHLNDGHATRIATVFMIGYFATSPFFGFLGDRFPRKWLIAIGIFVWSLGTVLTGFAAGLTMLLAFRVLVGVGEASYATISPSLISDSYGATRRNQALTLFYVAIPVGAAMGYFFGGQMAEHYSWRNAFIWAGAPGLLLALVLLPFAEPKRGEAEGSGPVRKPTVGDILNLFRSPRYLVVVFGYVAYTFALGAFGNLGPMFFKSIHGMRLDQAGNFFGGVMVVTGLLGTFIGGFLASAWQKRRPYGYALVMGLSVLLAVPFATMAFLSQDRLQSQICMGVAMFLLFFPTGPVNTVILESVPVNLHASAIAVSIFMIHLFGDLWSTEIVGHLSDHWNDLRKAVLILPGALVVAALLWLALVPMMRGKPKEGAA
jgi:MFS family permease